MDQKLGIRNVNQARQPFDEFGLRVQEGLDGIFFAQTIALLHAELSHYRPLEIQCVFLCFEPD